MKKYFEIALLIASLFVAAIFINQSRYLRSLGYETVPEPYVTDEYNYVWQAVSLQKYGLPVAWTVFKGVYSDSKFGAIQGGLQGLGITIDDKIVTLQDFKKNPKPITAVSEIDWGKGLEHMSFVAPFLDHSPLGGLIYSLGVSRDITQFNQIKPSDFRKSALVMAIITSVLLFIFIFQITKKPWIAALSTAVYSTVPTYIFSSRGAYLENVVSPFMLGHLIILLASVGLFSKRRIGLSYILVFISGLFGGLGGLSKEISLGFLAGSLIIVLIKKLPIKYLLTLVLGILVPIIVYIVWALWLQKDLFIAIILTNSVRSDFGSLKLLTMLESLRFRGFPIDGWWIWGIISAFFVGSKIDFKKNDYIFLILPLLCNFMALIFMANSNYPWYWISMTPFLAGASAIMIGELFENPKLTALIGFFFIPFSSSFYWGYSVFHQNTVQNLNVYRGCFLILLVVYVVRSIFARNKYSRYLWMGILALILFELFRWNFRSIQFTVANWNNLPIPSIPEL